MTLAAIILFYISTVVISFGAGMVTCMAIENAELEKEIRKTRQSNEKDK